MSNSVRPEIDVAIIGGGPAGAAVAIALQNQGEKRVALLEQSRQDDFRIGETVPPNIRVLLEQLGVFHRFEQDRHLRSSGNCSAWGSDELGFQDFFFYPGGHGWHLDRVRFDAALASAARERGAILMRETAVVKCDRLADGKWGLKLRTKDGCQLQVKTSFVVDASGRRSLFATWQGTNKIRTDHLMGIASVFALEKEVPQDYYTLVEAAEYGWWYAARLPDNRAIVTLMSDREVLSRYGLLQPETWTAYLKPTRYVQELIHQACSQSKLLIQPAFSQYLDRMTGDRWLAVGDAACTLDPLSSAGIYKALQSGIKAALAISRYFDGERDALAAYEAQTRHQFEVYLQDQRKYYAKETRWPNSPFWQRSRGRIVLSPSKPLFFQESPEIASTLRRLKMYLPAPDLQLLCQMSTSGKIASHVVSEFLTKTEHKVSAYRVIEALQYLLENKVIHALDCDEERHFFAHVPIQKF